MTLFKNMNQKYQTKENIKKIGNSENFIDLDKYDINIFNNINNKDLNRCSRMWENQKEFLNGVVRKFKPKKVLEIGVAEGGSSIIALKIYFSIYQINGVYLQEIFLPNL